MSQQLWLAAHPTTPQTETVLKGTSGINPVPSDGGADQLRVGGSEVARRETADEIVVLDLKGSVDFG